jgi:hypothetical protein
VLPAKADVAAGHTRQHAALSISAALDFDDRWSRRLFQKSTARKQAMQKSSSSGVPIGHVRIRLENHLRANKPNFVLRIAVSVVREIVATTPGKIMRLHHKK